MANSTLQEALTPKQREAGLYLEEDEDFIYLYDGDGTRRAVFSATGATAESIRREADRLLREQS